MEYTHLFSGSEDGWLLRSPVVGIFMGIFLLFQQSSNLGHGGNDGIIAIPLDLQSADVSTNIPEQSSESFCTMQDAQIPDASIGPILNLSKC